MDTPSHYHDQVHPCLPLNWVKLTSFDFAGKSTVAHNTFARHVAVPDSPISTGTPLIIKII